MMDRATPLDEKGHDASTQALLDAFPMADKIAAMYAEVAIRAYLSAAPALAVSQPIGDGMEVVAWQSRIKPGGNWVFDQIGFDLDFRSKSEAAGYEWRPLVRLSDAQALIAAKDARIEELTRDLEAARAGAEITGIARFAVSREIESVTVWDKEDGSTHRFIPAHAAEARIKALEDALRPFADNPDGWTVDQVNAARATLNRKD